MFAVSDATLTVAAFAAVSSFVLLVHLLTHGEKDPVQRRLHTLAHSPTTYPLAGTSGTSATFVFAPPKAEPSAAVPAERRPAAEHGQAPLQRRLVEAGLYTSHSIAVFNTIRLALPAAAAALTYLICLPLHCNPQSVIVYCLFGGVIGLLLPGVYLARVKRARQTKIRRALPDALDVMTICMQGGLSLNAALDQVVRELSIAHPMLATELHIVQRQVQLGQTVGQSLREMAYRLDLEELRSMAGVIIQAERVGASLATALNTFARGLRQNRQQRAEEMAHKTGVKILFPTLFFIFPVIFGVILGPAAIQIYHDVIQGGLFHVSH